MRSPSGGSSSHLRARRTGTPEVSGAERIRRAIQLANDAADGAGDEEVTPSEIARAIEDALKAPDVGHDRGTEQYLRDALDAVADGMPPDHTAMILYAALGRMRWS